MMKMKTASFMENMFQESELAGVLVFQETYLRVLDLTLSANVN